MKVWLLIVSFVTLFLQGCSRKPKTIVETPGPVPEMQEKSSAETSDKSETGIEAAPTPTDTELRMQRQLDVVGALKHKWLSHLALFKKQLFGWFFLDAWDEMEKSQRSQSEMEQIEMSLRKEDDRSDADYHAKIVLLANLAVTSESSKLDKEAEVLFDKWSERFPQGSGPAPTRNDLKELSREIKAIFDQLKKLPKLTSQQLEAEISALPPLPDPGVFVR